MVLWVSLGSHGRYAAAATLTGVNEWRLICFARANPSGSANLDLKLLRAGVDPVRVIEPPPSVFRTYEQRPFAELAEALADA